MEQEQNVLAVRPNSISTAASEQSRHLDMKVAAPNGHVSENEMEVKNVKCWELDRWSCKAYLRLVLFLCLVGSIVALFTLVDVFSHLNTFSAWAEENQATGVLSYIGIYAILTVLCFPGLLLTIAAGLVFGLWKGALATLVGATLGAGLSFLVGRYLFKSIADNLTNRYKSMKAVNTVVTNSAFRFTFLLRLSPIIPFTALNYTLALTSVPFVSYVAATFFGIAPGTCLFVYIGSTVMSIKDIQERNVEQSTGTQVLFWVGLAITILVTVLLTALARKQIKKEVAEAESTEDEEVESAASDLEAGTLKEEARSAKDERDTAALVSRVAGSDFGRGKGEAVSSTDAC